MKYLTSKEISEKWNISQRRIIRLAEDGRIEGARKLGKVWMFPEDAVKPADGRTRNFKIANGMTQSSGADSGKAQKPDSASCKAGAGDATASPFFRYPAYEHKDPTSFDPPLSKEELQLKAATEAFHACRFKEAERIVGHLPEEAEDRYIRITALYTGCMVDILQDNYSRFLSRYAHLSLKLQEDFPHALEMREFLNEINAILGVNDYYANEFYVDPGYDYHASFIPRLANLSAVSLSFPEKQMTVADLKAHELNCIFLENTTNYSDLQALHVYMGTAYAFMDKKAEATNHFRKALALAEKYDLYFGIAEPYYLMKILFRPAISEFSAAFKAKLAKISDDVNSRLVRFLDKISEDSIYKLLPSRDWSFIFYAVHGYSIKEVANRLHISESTVGKRYSSIYSQVGVSSKKELVELYERSVATSSL